ncbi:MAG: DUF2953 domain-containing protein [Porcipelethomonas sp.]
MTALIITGIILFILLTLLFSPVRIYFDCMDGKRNVVMKYLFIRKNFDSIGENLSASDPGKKADSSGKNKSRKSGEGKLQSDDKDSKKAGKEKSGAEKKGIFPEDRGEQIDFVLSVVNAGGKALKTALKRISVTKIFIDFKVSDPDAYECAIKYGKINAALYNGLKLMNRFFTLKKESINVRCVFNEENCVYNIRFCVKVRPSAVIWTGILFIFTFLVNNNRRKKKRAAGNEKEELRAA